MFEISDDYIREINAAYWAEEYEMKMGIHPLQIKERVLSVLKRDNVTFSEYIQNFWPSGPRVEIILLMGIFMEFLITNLMNSNPPQIVD